MLDSIVSGDEGLLDNLDQPAADAVGHSATHQRRENMLLWFIGTIFGAAMLLLLLGMIVAEMSIHRTSSSVQPDDASAVPPTYSIVAAR
jgi:hypothetical protein